MNEKKAIYKAPTIEEFRKMSPTEKRVAIAKDILAALEAELYIATKGSYIDEFKVGDTIVCDYRYSNWDSQWVDKDIQKLLPEMKECKVCALGACVLSITKYENKLKLSDVGGSVDKFSKETDELIQGIFSPEQLLIIETMFEGNCGTKYASNRLDAKKDYDIIDVCNDWYIRAADDPTVRMQDIWKLVIASGGEIDVKTLNK